MDANTKEIERFEKHIARLSKRGIPIAVQQTLTATARNAYNAGQMLTDNKFTNRNAWTKRSESYQRAEGLNVRQMKSEFGSTEDYMRKQEEGFTNSNPKGVMVPTAEAAGQAAGGRRTKPIRKPFRRGNMTLGRRKKKFANKDQQRIASVIDTFNAKRKFWYGTLGGYKGMWRFVGGRRSKKGGWPKGMRPHLLYSATEKTNHTRATPIIGDASEKAMKEMPAEYFKALGRQIDRLNKK